MDVHAVMGNGKEEQKVPISEIVVTPEEMEQISDPGVLLTKPLQLENLLEEHDALSLPRHSRCISHTLNILVTRYVSNVPRWFSGAKDPFNKTLDLPKHRHCGKPKIGKLQLLRESRRS